MLLTTKVLASFAVGLVLCAVPACSPAPAPAAPPSPTSIPSTAIPSTSTSAPVVPSATASSLPNGWKPFTSQKYHYSIAYPGDWRATPAQELLTQGIPHLYDDTVDTFESPDRKNTRVVGIGAVQLKEATTLEGWTSITIQNWKNDLACEPSSRASTNVAGEPATLLTFGSCGAFFTENVLLVHGPSGFFITWNSLPGNEAGDRGMFQSMLATMTFAK